MANGFLLRSLPFTSTAVSNTQPGNPASNLANDFMGMEFRAPTGEVWGAQIDLGDNIPFDFMALLNCSATSADFWRVRGDSVANWTTPTTETGNMPIPAETRTAAGRQHLLLPIAAPASRFWRIEIVARAGVSHAAARLVVGNRLQPGRNFSFGAGRGVNDLGNTEFAPRGAFLRRNAAKRRTLGLTWQYLTELEAEQQALPFLEAVGTTECVLASLDPDTDPQRTRRIYFGPLQGSLGLSWRQRDRWEKRVQLVSLV